MVGVDEIETSAAAEATIARTVGSSGGFPAGAFSGTAAGSEFCLKASTPGPGGNCDSARFTTIPVFHQSVPNGSNACCYDIAGGLPIFIESIWTVDSPPMCSGEIAMVMASGTCRHDAGMQGSIMGPPGVSRIESSSALVIRPSHLPDTAAQ